jgi:FkbM family methyltransferase
MSSEKLKAAISAVYDRLAQKKLGSSDICKSESIKFASNPTWIQRDFEAKKVTQKDALVFRRFTAGMGTILDVGAQWGYMALSIRFAGTNCPIISFEALNAHQASLQRLKDLDQTGFDYKISAVSNRTGDVTLYGPVVNDTPIYGLNSVDGKLFVAWHANYIASLLGKAIPVAKKYKFQLLETKVQAKPLDLLLEEGGFSVPAQKIASIKISVEGHELQVLEGAAKTIKRDKPFILIKGGKRHPTVVSFMEKHGYLYASLEGDQIFEGRSSGTEANGCWFSLKRAKEYKKLGFLVRDPNRSWQQRIKETFAM